MRTCSEWWNDWNVFCFISRQTWKKTLKCWITNSWYSSLQWVHHWLVKNPKDLLKFKMSSSKAVASRGYHVHRLTNWRYIEEDRIVFFAFETRAEAVNYDAYSHCSPNISAWQSCPCNSLTYSFGVVKVGLPFHGARWYFIWSCAIDFV